MPRIGSHNGKRQKRVSELDLIEERMGRLASVLSEMADALSEYPGALNLQSSGGGRQAARMADAITVRAAEWPTFEEIQRLVATWQREQARAAVVPTAHLLHRPLERV